MNLKKLTPYHLQGESLETIEDFRHRPLLNKFYRSFTIKKINNNSLTDLGKVNLNNSLLYLSISISLKHIYRNNLSKNLNDLHSCVYSCDTCQSPEKERLKIHTRLGMSVS